MRVPGWRLELERRKDFAIVSVEGELDVATAPRLREALEVAMDQGFARIVVDATRVTYIDSMGLGILVSGERRLRGRGGELVVACHTPAVRRTFTITGLDAFLTLRESRADALGAATMTCPA